MEAEATPMKFSPGAIAYYLTIHLACLGVFWTGVSWQLVSLCLASYFGRHLFLSIGYHRYFAHRSFKTSRTFQFLLALLGSTCNERGVLWWAETHRYHHRHSDTEEDLHSPLFQGFLYAHSGWFLDAKHRETRLDRVRDLAKFPELVWLDRFPGLVMLAFGAVVFGLFGWQGIIWGFCLSTVMIWHTTHHIQSISHRFGGYRRFPTSDNSRNHWVFGLVSMGEGFHNNHHHKPSSATNSYAWWELDLSYLILAGLNRLGIVWDLNLGPEERQPAIAGAEASGA